jgi:hypothetical protein
MTLEDVFEKWILLTRQQREFLLAAVMSDKFSLADVNALLNKWYEEARVP